MPDIPQEGYFRKLLNAILHHPQSPNELLLNAMNDPRYFPANQGPVRRIKMLDQMEEARGVSDAVPRALPDLPTNYQPSERWNYGKPVRVG